MFSLDKEKILKTGVVFLVVATFLVASLIGAFESVSLHFLPTLGSRSFQQKVVSSVDIPFDLKSEKINFSMPDLEKELTVSLDRPRPDIHSSDPACFLVRIRKSGVSKNVTLPARIDLFYDKGLQFAKNESSYFALLEPIDDSSVFVRAFVSDEQSGPCEVAQFQMFAEPAPCRSAQDFSENSPLRALAEAKLLGKDLVLGKLGKTAPFSRVEFPQSKGHLRLEKGNFLGWNGQSWVKISTPADAKEGYLARVTGLSEKSLQFEAWGLDEYSLICISSSTPPQMKTRIEDILTSVRVRSEKQISCMLEKQCFVLKAGDWVLKTENRWKVLRKAEERDAYLNGNLEGDLLVFDRIGQSGGQKVLYGSLFDAGRSQMLTVEYATSSRKKELTTASKGKVK